MRSRSSFGRSLGRRIRARGGNVKWRTPAQLNQLNPAVVPYITHVHVALAGFIAATAIAVMGLAWFGVRAGALWALITAVVSPVVGLAVALPMHYLGRFELDWVGHLGPVYLGTLVF